MTDLLTKTIAEYRAQYGEPEYRYFKKWIAWSKPRRERGYHITPIGDGEEVSREEYEANVTESSRAQTEAFMGRFPQSYWRYDRKMSKDGWCETLVKDVQKIAQLA